MFTCGVKYASSVRSAALTSLSHVRPRVHRDRSEFQKLFEQHPCLHNVIVTPSFERLPRFLNHGVILKSFLPMPPSCSHARAIKQQYSSKIIFRDHKYRGNFFSFLSRTSRSLGGWPIIFQGWKEGRIGCVA